MQSLSDADHPRINGGDNYSDARGYRRWRKDVVWRTLTVNKALHWLHWLHTLATEGLTWVARHAKRGAAAFTDLLILPQFMGTLIHDGWAPYRKLCCAHGLCNAHHLRELHYVREELKQDWAGDMVELLTHANHQDNLNRAEGRLPDYRGPAYQLALHDLRSLYEAILDQGELANPRAPPTGKRGRAKQSKAANLIHRLRDYGDDVWRFMSEAGVPFMNNLAEQAVRSPKAAQKNIRLLPHHGGGRHLLRHPLLLGHPAQAGR